MRTGRHNRLHALAFIDRPDNQIGGRFYVFSHPHALASVQTRMEDVMNLRNPTSPFAGKPEIGEQLKAALRAS